MLRTRGTCRAGLQRHSQLPQASSWSVPPFPFLPVSFCLVFVLTSFSQKTGELCQRVLEYLFRELVGTNSKVYIIRPGELFKNFTLLCSSRQDIVGKWVTLLQLSYLRNVKKDRKIQFQGFYCSHGHIFLLFQKIFILLLICMLQS